MLHKLQLETLILDYGYEETMSAYQNSKKYFGGQSWYYDYDIAVTEYGSFDNLVIASLLFSIEKTGGLDRYADTVKQFVSLLERETRNLSTDVRLNSFSEIQLNNLIPPPYSPSREDRGSIPIGRGVSLNHIKVKLTNKQYDAVSTFASTNSWRETASLMGVTPLAVKQLLQRARKALS